MNTISEFLSKITGFFNTKTRKLGLAILLSALLLRFPFVVKFLPKDLYDAIMSSASAVVTFAIPVVTFFVKDMLQTGGKIPTTPEAELRLKELSESLEAAEKKVREAAEASAAAVVIGQVLKPADKPADEKAA